MIHTKFKTALMILPILVGFGMASNGWLGQIVVEEDVSNYDYTIDVINKRFEPAGKTSVETQSTQMKFEIFANLKTLSEDSIGVDVSAYHVVVEQSSGSLTQYYDSYGSEFTGVAEMLHEQLKPVLESSSKAVVNSSGKMLHSPESDDPTGSLNNLVEGLFFDFPKTELSRGDSWVVQRGGETPNPVTMVLSEISKKTVVAEYKITKVDTSSGVSLKVNTIGIVAFSAKSGMIEKYEENQEYFSEEGIKLGSISTKISRN